MTKVVIHSPIIRRRRTINEGSIQYVGESQIPNALDNRAVWKIERLIQGVIEGASDFVGADNFDQILSDRESIFPPILVGSIFALLYDGVNDDVIVNDATLLRLEWDQPWTIAGWFDLEASAATRIFLSKLLSTNRRGYEISLAANKIRFQIASGTENRIVIETNSALVGRQHVVCINDGSGLASGLKIITNNIDRPVSIIQDNLLGNTIISSNNLSFGSRNGAFYTGMTQDNTQIINKVLNLTEVAELYAGNTVVNAQSLSFEADLITQWRFEDRGLGGLIRDDINSLNGNTRGFDNIDEAFVEGL